MAQEIQHGLEGGDWASAPADVSETLDQTTVDLWLISLEQPVQLELLSEDELARFKRYRFQKDQRKFAVARSSLRRILANYVWQSPAALSFDYGPYGKPYLRDNIGLQFNLSHSGEYALCGVAKKSLGVDIEHLRSMDRLEGLIKRCLAPCEQASLATMSAEQQSSMFLRYWTCKEAYLKATGQGISESLSAIEVIFTPQAQLKGQDWLLQTFIPCEGYIAAAVTQPEVNQIRLWAYGL